MVLGDTTQKLQKVANMAEDLYKKLNELRQQVVALREQLDETSEDVSSVKRDVEEQRAILTALAEQEGIDVDQVIADATIEEAEGDAGEATADGDADGSADDATSVADAGPGADTPAADSTTDSN